MKQNIILGAVVVVLLAAIAGGYYYPKFTVLSGATGSTFTTAKYAGVAIDLSTNTGATSTSILNTDTSSRYITNTAVTCTNMGSSFTAVTGTGLATLQLTIGTSTSASPAAVVSVGPFSRVASALVFSTSTAPIGQLASTTLQTSTSTLGVLWKSGEYLSFWWNATNTPASGQTTVPCTEGVYYTGS